MENLLSEPYCEFDPEEWLTQTGVPSAKDTARDDFPATVMDCPFRSKSSCPIHNSIDGHSPSEDANRLLRHFGKSPPDEIDKRQYYAVSGVEVSGFDLQGQTLFAEQAREVDLRHLIVHNQFNIAQGAIANRLTVANSLFRGSVVADRVQADERLSLNHSRIEGNVSFGSAELRGGLEIREATIEGSLSLGTAVVSEDVDLSGTKIEGDLNLSRARVQGTLDLTDVTIEGDCFLGEIQVAGRIQAPRLQAERINFNHASITGHILFTNITINRIKGRSASVGGTFNLVSSEISNDVVLKMLDIDGGTRIGELEVGEDLTLSGSQLDHQAQIWDVDIEGKLNLNKVNCSHHLYIQGSEIGGGLDFASCELGSFTRLIDMEISERLCGDATNATGLILLKDLDITGELELRDLAIKEHLQVDNCRITGHCSIAGTRTTEKIQFYDTSVGGPLDALETEIGQNFQIYESRVRGPVELTESQAGAIQISPDSVIGGLKLGGTRITTHSLDISEVRIRGEIVLDDAVIERDLNIGDLTAHSISMENGTVKGHVDGTNISVGYLTGDGSFDADQLTVEGDIDLRGAQIRGDLRFARSTIKGDFTLDTSWIDGEFRLGSSHLYGEIIAANVNWGQVTLDGTTLEEDLLFLGAKLGGELVANQLTSNGETVTIVQSSIAEDLKINHAEFSGDFVLSESVVNSGNQASDESNLNTTTVLQAAGVEIDGELLIESSLLHGGADISEAKIDGLLHLTEVERNEDKEAEKSHSTVIDGDLDLTDSIIEQQLILNAVHPSGDILVSDIVVGSKTIIEDITAGEIDFSESFFKWNVKIEDVYVENLDFTDSSFQNELTISKTVVSDNRLRLRESRINTAEVNRGYSSVQIDCTEAKIEELKVNGFEDTDIWDDIRIEKTRFDGFDFTGFTSSLHNVKYRIHYNRDVEPFYRRFGNFWKTFFKRVRKSFRFGNSVVPQRNLDTIQEIRTNHLDREITYRRAKDSADATSDNTAASEFYRLEKKHRRRRRFWEIIGAGGRKLSNLASYFANLLMGAISGHGERISLVGISAGTFIILFTGFYLLTPSFVTALTSDASLLELFDIDKRSLIDYASLSIASFANIPNTIPNGTSQLIRFTSYVERLIGAAYIPLLVFTLTRSLHR